MTKILFICTGNSFRSPVAEALAKKYRPELNVISAGTYPANLIARNGKNLLKQENALHFVKDTPEPLSQDKIQVADKIVVMENNHVRHLQENFDLDNSKIENWQIKDPIDPDVKAEKSFQQIKEKVLQL